MKAATFEFRRSHGLALFALALALRLGHVATMHSTGASGLFLDAEVMANTARGVGSTLPAGETPYLLSPLYPYLMAPFLGSDHLLGMRLAQAAMGAITALLVARIASRLAGSRAGWIAGLLAALHGPSIYYEGEILVAGPQALLVVAASYLALGAEDAGNGARRWFGSGWALGLSSALRPTTLPLALVLLIHGGRKGGAAATKRILAGLAIAILPFSASNLLTSGEPVLLTASGGFNFWVGNHHDASGLFEAPQGYDLATDPVALTLARDQSGQALDYRGASAWWRNRALSDIAEAPWDACKRLCRKIFFFMHPVEIPQLGPGHALARDQSIWVRWPLDSRWLLVLALCAPLISRRTLPLWSGMLTYAAVLVAFFVVGRYRAPILPIAAALAGITLDGMWSALAAGRPRGRVVAGLLIGLGAVSLLLQHHGLQVNPRGGADMQARRAGLQLVQEGRGQEAVELLSAALAEHDNPSTRTALGLALASTGQAAAAATEYRRVLEQDSARSEAAFQLASLLVGPLAGDNDTQRLASTREAEALLRSALVVRPNWAEAHFNLGVTLLRQLRFGEALNSVETALGLADPQAPWRSEARRVQEIARTRQGSGGNQ